MKTDSKALASFLAAAVWADGEYCEFEQSLVADMGSIGCKDPYTRFRGSYRCY